MKHVECVYIVCGDEVGDQGTPHLQGYVHFEHPRSLEAVQGAIGGRGHLTVAKGSAAQNKAYCSKQQIFFEGGVMPVQGARNDVQVAKDIIKAGGSIGDVIRSTTSFQAVRFAEVCLRYADAPNRDPPVVTWYWGRSGAGKTRRAMAEASAIGRTWISSFDCLKWWQGYDGHKCVVLDDLRPSSCSLPYLLRVLDRYPVQVETKGGSMWLAATHIWLTSLVHPAQMSWAGEPVEQLLRRLTTTIEIV